jgi:predicted alpha/beta superfamily hydrolase
MACHLAIKNMKPLYLFCFLLCWGASTSYAQEKDFVLGKILKIQSEQLQEERTLNIYFPYNYQIDSLQKFPVIYLLDGSVDEDFIHIAGLVQFNNFPWINRLPPSIIVGIANVDRKRDFTFPTSVKKDKKQFPTTGGSKKFIQFIEKELQPFIENKYRVSDDRTIIGQSLGGLLASEILQSKSHLFNRYIIVSPSLWWDKESLLKKKFVAPENSAIFVAVGKEGKVMERTAEQLYNHLKMAKGKNAQVYFSFLEREDHATILHSAVDEAFRKFYAE